MHAKELFISVGSATAYAVAIHEGMLRGQPVGPDLARTAPADNTIRLGIGLGRKLPRMQEMPPEELQGPGEDVARAIVIVHNLERVVT